VGFPSGPRKYPRLRGGGDTIPRKGDDPLQRLRSSLFWEGRGGGGEVSSPEGKRGKRKGRRARPEMGSLRAAEEKIKGGREGGKFFLGGGKIKGGPLDARQHSKTLSERGGKGPSPLGLERRGGGGEKLEPNKV